MYQEFLVLSIDSILNKKQILISTNRDIDPNTLKDTIIEVYERGTKTPLLFEPIIEGKNLAINLREWPIPNTDYILSVKGIKSIADETLPSSIKRKIIFESQVVSKVNILSPSMFEKIADPFIELKEFAEKEEFLLNSFYIEASTDNAFYNIIAKGTFNKPVFRLSLNKNKQYFIRARVQTNDEDIQYGLWSEVVTFVYGEEVDDGGLPDITEPEDPDDEETTPDDGPVVDLDMFEIISEIEQGMTPEQLIIEFSKDIDMFSIDNIIITRKVVK